MGRFKRSAGIGKSLQGRLTLEIAALFMAGLGGVGLWTGWKMQQMLIAGRLQTVQYIANRFPQDVQVYSQMLPLKEGLARTIKNVSGPGLVVWVKDDKGNVLAQSSELNQDPATSEALMDIVAMPLQPGIYQIRQRYFVLCENHFTEAAGTTGKVYLAQDVTQEQQQLQAALTSLILVVSLATLLMMAAMALRIRRALRPLKELSQLAQSVSADGLQQAELQLAEAPEEVVALAQSLKVMLDHLGDAWEQQRQFVSNVSHELRTPLTIMLGYVQMVLRRGSNLNENQREALETAVTEGQRTVQLLQDLLDLARADSGHLRVNLQPVGVNDLVLELAQTLQTHHQRSIIVEAPSPLHAQADRERLRQILVNLLENALKYSEPNQPIHVQLQKAERKILIHVKDQGMGIPIPDQNRIFERFYRVDEARTRTSGGTGLGLAIVKTLVESMGGMISVQSQPGQGSTFTIALNAA
jgi:heavy metal sensor kinase